MFKKQVTYVKQTSGARGGPRDIPAGVVATRSRGNFLYIFFIHTESADISWSKELITAKICGDYEN